jgi:hypothetical protein
VARATPGFGGSSILLGEEGGAAKEAARLIVRESSREDINNLAHLMSELGYLSSTEDMGRRFEEISADPSYDAFIVEQDGEVLGMVGLPTEPCLPYANVPTLTIVAVK